MAIPVPTCRKASVLSAAAAAQPDGHPCMLVSHQRGSHRLSLLKEWDHGCIAKEYHLRRKRREVGVGCFLTDWDMETGMGYIVDEGVLSSSKWLIRACVAYDEVQSLFVYPVKYTTFVSNPWIRCTSVLSYIGKPSIKPLPNLLLPLVYKGVDPDRYLEPSGFNSPDRAHMTIVCGRYSYIHHPKSVFL